MALTLGLLLLAFPPRIGAPGGWAVPASWVREGGAPRAPSEGEEVGGAGGTDAVQWTWGGGRRFGVNVYGNFLARKDTEALFDQEGNEFTDTARIRQLDFILDAEVADGVEALVAATVQSDLANTGYELEIEQAFLRVGELPVVGGLPKGLTVLLGQFRVGFGRLNRERVYDLPQITRPRALTQFFGETGYSELGASGTYDVPVADAGSLRLTAEYLDSGSEPLALEEGGATGATVFRLGWASAPDARHGLELGGSLFNGRRADRDPSRAELTGVDALFSWSAEESARPCFFLGGEWISSELDRLDGSADEPEGFYLWSQVWLDEAWYAGARLDVSEELADERLSTETVGLFLGHVPSPGLRYALGVETTESDVALLDGATRVFAELNFAVGTGPHRPFWMAP